jgi:hypothetical protein
VAGMAKQSFRAQPPWKHNRILDETVIVVFGNVTNCLQNKRITVLQMRL